MLREFGNILSYIGIISIALTFIWSWYLGSKQGVVWFLGLVFVWVIAYPIFVIKFWQKAKFNFYSLLASIGIIAISFFVLAATNPTNTV